MVLKLVVVVPTTALIDGKVRDVQFAPPVKEMAPSSVVLKVYAGVFVEVRDGVTGLISRTIGRVVSLKRISCTRLEVFPAASTMNNSPRILPSERLDRSRDELMFPRESIVVVPVTCVVVARTL